MYLSELLLLRFREDFALEQTLFTVAYKFFPYSGLQGICQVGIVYYISTDFYAVTSDKNISVIFCCFFSCVLDSKFCFDDWKTSIMLAAANSPGWVLQYILFFSAMPQPQSYVAMWDSASLWKGIMLPTLRGNLENIKLIFLKNKNNIYK